jgi:hypothetical protein
VLKLDFVGALTCLWLPLTITIFTAQQPDIYAKVTDRLQGQLSHRLA